MKRLLALGASAGTGKTYNLVARYLSLLFLGNNPSDILAITFTNKASNEMRERVIESLEDLSDDLLDNITKQTNLTLKQIKDKKDVIYKNFLSSDLNIMTIDKFFNKIFRKFSWYENIENDFEIANASDVEIFKLFLNLLSQKEYDDLVSFARYEGKKHNSFIDIFSELYEKDKELPNFDISEIKSNEKELLLIANKIKNSIESCEKASNSAKKAVDFNDIDSLLEKGWLKKESLNDYSYFKKCFVEEMDYNFKLLKEHLKIYFLHKEARTLKMIFNFYKKFKEAKKRYSQENSILYFKDIENLTYDLLQKNEISDFIYFRLDSKITHILIDEFQDTSITQYKIFEPIIEEIVQDNDRTLFYVGDTKQAIYRFRGGQKELFDYVSSNFDIPKESLNVNYRSKKAIVEFVNRTFNVQPTQKAHNQKDGYVEIQTGDILETTLKKSLEQLFEKGVDDNDITILVRENQSILDVESKIKEWWPTKACITTQKAKVINQKNVKAILNLMKYLYYQPKQAEIYKLNFLSLTGKNYSDEKINIPISKPYFMIKTIIEEFKLVGDDTIKLLEYSLKFENLTEFIMNINSFSDEMPSKDLNGITIMTIHKSKGLAFENVIICDTLKGKNSDRNTLIFDYENIDIKDIKVRIKSRENFDSEYKKLLENQKELNQLDDRNLHYVGFTRAKNSLFILKKDKNSVFEYLNLVDSKMGELLNDKNKKEETIIQKIESDLTNYGKQEIHKQKKEYKINDYDSIYLGLAIHYLFETDNKSGCKNKFGEIVDINLAIKLYENAKNHKNYTSLLSDKIQKELPFIYDDELGFVDLVIFGDDDIRIIDYKSTKPNDLRNYKYQVNRYKTALNEIYKKPTKGYLYFIDSCEMMII